MGIFPGYVGKIIEPSIFMAGQPNTKNQASGKKGLSNWGALINPVLTLLISLKITWKNILKNPPGTQERVIKCSDATGYGGEIKQCNMYI